ncbi:MAG TPA: 4Fe-4S binding protein [Methanoregula sp.]|nr:4Fe-4S binding protein [Methanoregula sp.]
MKIIFSLRRSLASLLLTAGLAYPVCAAVCPKGIGGCPSPGRCFLFTDVDGNALCDYTGRSVSSVTGTTAPAAPAQGSAAAPAQSVIPVPPSPKPTTSLLQNTSTAGISDTILGSVPLTATVLFIVFAGIFFALFRTGIAGIRIDRPLPALGLSAFLGLGFSLMATLIVSGAGAAGTTFALVYMGAGTFLAMYLWYRGAMARRAIFLTVLTSTLTGFVFLAPIMPLELGGLVNVLTGLTPVSAGIVVILAIIAFTLLAGRTFCGAVCPVGSVQEVAFSVPLSKVTFHHPYIPELIRLVVFGSAVLLAVYLIDLLAFTGLYDLFSLTLSASFLAGAGILVFSVFLYRPVCRFLCPFGVLFSIPAAFSRLRLRRTEVCINCSKCEKACPAGVAGRDDSKRECYLCGRCTTACRVKGALEYR